MELNIIFNGGALRRKAVRRIQGKSVAYETLYLQKKKRTYNAGISEGMTAACSLSLPTSDS